MAWSDHYRYDKFLYCDAADTVFAARVNQASFTYPIADITYDGVTVGAYTDIAVDMHVLFGSSAGASDLGRGRIRKAPTADTLYIGWSSRGIRDGECNLANDAYITVLDDYRALAKIPRITATGVLYKDYDIAAATGTPSPPVANGGEDVFQMVDSNNEIDVPFDGSNSFPTAPGASISTYAWDFADGTPASAATATVASVVFPGGKRYVHLTVTDSNGKTHTHHIKVVAGYDTTGEASYSGASFTAEDAGPGQGADKAFDNNTGTAWYMEGAAGPQGWVQVEFASDVVMVGYEIDAGSGAQLADMMRDWTVKVDAGLTTVDTQTDQSFSAGEKKTFYIEETTTSIVRLDVTDNNGGATHPNAVSLSEFNILVRSTNVITQFAVTRQTLTRNGQEFAVRIDEALPQGTYYDGFKVLYCEREYYDDVETYLAGPSGREGLKFSGWHNTDTASLMASEAAYSTGTEFTCVDIGGRMRQLPAFPQAVLRDTSPTTWLQLDDANTDRYVHYLLHWHSTVLSVAPFTWSGTGDTYALPRFQSPGQNLWEQVYFRATSIAHELTVSMRGALGLTPDPLLQDSGDRTATVITDIDPDSWGGMTYMHMRPPRVYWLWGNAIVANTQEADASDLNIVPVFCVAPGKAPGQGEMEQTQGEQIVADQDELNARMGHLYARLNAFDGLFDIPLTHPGDIGLDPARMEWARSTITTALAGQRGETFTDERFLPSELDIVHNNVTQTKEQFLRAERETVGTPAQTVIVPTGTVLPDTPDIDDWPWVYEEPTGYGLHRGQTTLAMFDFSANMHITTDFDAVSPTWTTTDLTGLAPALSGAFLSMVADPFSPKYLTGSGAVNGWILTDTGIYSISDIFGVSGGPTLALQHTLATANPSFGFLAAGVGVEDWIVGAVEYTNSTGTKCLYTTDGSNWSESVISAHYSTVAVFSVNHVQAIYPSSFQAGLVYAGARTSTGSQPPGDLFKSTDYGATWSAASTPAVSFGDFNGGLFTIPWHDNPSQLLSYWGNYNKSTQVFQLYRTDADGTTTTNISPESQFGGVFGFWQMSICPINRQRLAFAGYGYSGGDVFATFVSQDAGDTWTRVTTDNSVYHIGIAIAGNDQDVIYAWGTNRRIDYSQDFGATWYNKNGNLSGASDIAIIIGG